MKALLLIGGLGTRLRPVTEAVPKQLIPIAGKPILYHLFDLLPAGIEEVVLAMGYRAEQVAEYVRAHPPGFPVRSVVESAPLGSGGAMRFAGERISDPFYLLNTDVVAAADLPALEALRVKRSALGVMALASVEDTRPYGVAALDGDRITRFVEKPPLGDAPSNWINAGISVWRREVLDAIPAERALSFEKEILPGLLDRGIYGHRLVGFWEDAGAPDRVLRAQRFLFDAGRATHPGLPSGAFGSPLVCRGADLVATGAEFGPYVHLGAGVRVASGARVADSVLMDRAEVGAGAVVTGSILGPRTSVPAGARVAGRILASDTPL
ncbi:MAG: sugar phosphate nucleotidyltransferase [Thermoplasmata archaeon]